VDNLKIYEQLSAIGEQLPDAWREQFALLALDLADPMSQRELLAAREATRRWAKDAGYVR
jgi:hypothetical protein